MPDRYVLRVGVEVFGSCGVAYDPDIMPHSLGVLCFRMHRSHLFVPAILDGQRHYKATVYATLEELIDGYVLGFVKEEIFTPAKPEHFRPFMGVHDA